MTREMFWMNSSNVFLGLYTFLLIYLLVNLITLQYGAKASPRVKRFDEVEMVEDGRQMGVREVARVKSLEDCMQLCRQCAGLVHYPDNVCIIFNTLSGNVLSSFGATCCFAHQGNLEGQTNLLNVWTRNPETNLLYKVIPYDCEQTPATYEELCVSEGGHLASIHSQQEDAFVSG
ncbi:unnamed protein product [Gongylonema pulchrum]|uniref:Apple domain-containing protein n=1 Tax=Gongylonema pulchrum TaxID=637853 RepID=A0A183EBF7_9BILA|nr:unnamed protein product [Gongylonema pulchrum]